MPDVRERADQSVRFPVFVDSSGRRRRMVKRALGMVAVVCLGYLVLLGFSFVGGPVTPGDLLALPGSLGDWRHEKVDTASELGRSPGAPAVPGGAGSSATAKPWSVPTQPAGGRARGRRDAGGRFHYWCPGSRREHAGRDGRAHIIRLVSLGAALLRGGLDHRAPQRPGEQRDWSTGHRHTQRPTAIGLRSGQRRFGRREQAREGGGEEHERQEEAGAGRGRQDRARAVAQAGLLRCVDVGI